VQHLAPGTKEDTASCTAFFEDLKRECGGYGIKKAAGRHLHDEAYAAGEVRAPHERWRDEIADEACARSPSMRRTERRWPLHDRGNFLDASHGSTNVLFRSSLLALAGQVIE
jgi:hypothetical protein